MSFWDGCSNEILASFVSVEKSCWDFEVLTVGLDSWRVGGECIGVQFRDSHGARSDSRPNIRNLILG